MASRAIPREEVAGLALALAIHAGLVALLVLKPAKAPTIAPPERISVTLSDDVGLTSTSPEPQAAAAPPAAPQIAPIAEPEPAPEPEPQPKLLPRLRPEPAPLPLPRPALRPVPQPRTTAAPPPRAATRTPPAPATRPATRPPGASRISDDFLRGVAGAQTTGASRNPPAATIGPAVRSAIGQAIARELKPHWVAPQGAEAELLITVVRFHLARDGSLVGEPEIVRQSGETAANRAQLQRHREQAVRAVRLAEPFDLPVEYYAGWQVVTSTFDKRLSQ